MLFPNTDIESGGCSALGSADFLFTSSYRSLRGKGVFAEINQPVSPNADDTRKQFHESVQEAFTAAKKAGICNPVVVGAVPFDLGQPSRLYIPIECDFFDRSEMVSTVNDCEAPIPRVEKMQSVPEERRFKQAVEQAIANFQHSDLRKAVLSRVLNVELAEKVSVDEILSRLIVQNPLGYHFRIPIEGDQELIGSSPELLVRKVANQLTSNPLAGSAKRQGDSERDLAVSQSLLTSSKDSYEHRLVIDEIRQVLAPYCNKLDIPTSPELISTPAMWHLSSLIRGQLDDPQLSALELACELHPTPAVCGFPTKDARNLIRLVEPFERGVFTGMVGWCDAEGNGEWVVTIRCGIVNGNQIQLFAGAGIVEDSCPEQEWQETRAKLGTMLNALGITQQEAL
ncbi:isochorismate synthase [Microbulbifer sp. OS29]|uniref:isochorismate synthase n=1 Tax=Microbulbifer okhotskensis TaxID=2926617 RepID=A0A9X2J7J2_9GAMM|nr:isochorismate synthase [Microbulbifer okhotskensis]MCO1334531.1 isochorismate synthase [Microbulbifer okhotskensis]